MLNNKDNTGTKKNVASKILGKEAKKQKENYVKTSTLFKKELK